MRSIRWLAIIVAALSASAALSGAAISVHGSPVDTGYNVGSTAAFRATVTGAGDPSRYAVFADVRYAGASSSVRVELQPESGGGPESHYLGRWPVPADAPTGLYTVTLAVEDRSNHQVVAFGQAPGFFAYKKRLQITRLALDKTLYAPGERIGCEITIANLTGKDLKSLRVEFSNENYPWISTFSGSQNAPGRMAVNPSLGLVVLRESLDIPAHGQATLPMEPAGTAAFLQGSQVAVMGAGGPARHEGAAPPEVDRYTVAVWDHDRQDLLDMQFSPQVIVREPGQTLPKPYSRNFTHPYNDEIDYSKYREFYPPGYSSPVISLDHSRTLYQPGDDVTLKATVKSLPGTGLHLEIRDTQGREIHAADVADIIARTFGRGADPSRLVHTAVR